MRKLKADRPTGIPMGLSAFNSEDTIKENDDSLTAYDGENIESVTSYINGMAAFEENGKIGFMDTKGRTVIPPQFDNKTPHRGWIQLTAGADGFHVCQYFQGHDYSIYTFKDDGYAAVAMGGKFGVIDRKGKFIIPPKFDLINAWQ